MAKFYAWNNFVTKNDEFGRPVEVIKPGDEVTASSLGVSDDEFKEYVMNGAVRTTKYPDMGNFTGSPVEWYREQAAKLSAGDYQQSMSALAESTDVAGETPAPATDKK